MKSIELPISAMEIAQFSVGEQVGLNGVISTLRSGVQRKLHEGSTLPFETYGSLSYHCGPDGQAKGKKWVVRSLAPDLPSVDFFPVDLFSRFQFRGLIGRGGMDPKIKEACQRYGTCYFHTFGGAGLALASHLKRVVDVHLRDEFSGPEAVWEIEVEDFPAIVTVDCTGTSLYEIVKDVSKRRFMNL